MVGHEHEVHVLRGVSGGGDEAEIAHVRGSENLAGDDLIEGEEGDAVVQSIAEVEAQPILPTHLSENDHSVPASHRQPLVGGAEEVGVERADGQGGGRGRTGSGATERC